MPSLVLTGHPCVGKTTLASLLAARALGHPSRAIAHVVHIREATACPDATKAKCYADGHAEKTTRAALKAEFDRAVMSQSQKNGGSDGGGGGTGSTLVILDSLNYIKGYRYELYCIAKAAGERHGVVWVMGDPSDGGIMTPGASSPGDALAKERNRRRKELQMRRESEAGTVEDDDVELDGYFEDDATMDALVLRFEPPDDKNRWENPLYKVDVTSVLPWGKDGTREGSEKPGDDAQTSPTKAVEVKDPPSQPTAAPKPAKMSASGFKRRGKKSTTTQQSAILPAGPSATANVPSSIASRNLASASASPITDNTSGSKRTIEEVIDNILDSFLTNIAPLTEGMSTLSHASAESNVLNQMDSVTQRVNRDILAAQKAASLAAGVGGKIFVTLGGDGDRRAMELAKPLYANELRGCRRQFLKWVAGHPMPDGTGEAKMAEAYVSYIESNI